MTSNQKIADDILRKCFECKENILSPFERCVIHPIICPHCGAHQKEFLLTLFQEDADVCVCSGKFFKYKCELKNESSSENMSEEDCLRRYLYKLWQGQSRYCKYFCGLYLTIEKIILHEKICTKRCQLTQCHIADCKWLGYLTGLIKHVAHFHAKELIVQSHCQVENEDIALNFDKPVKLLLQFQPTYPTNKLYWIRLSATEKRRYFMIQYLGSCGFDMITSYDLQSYTIWSVADSSVKLISKIRKHAIDKYIFSDEIMEAFGINISSLIGTEYYLKVSSPEMNAAFINKTIMEELKCCICMCTMSSPIVTCFTGHSVCQKCSKKVHECPKCEKSYHSTRNFALETIAEYVETSCPYKDFGCHQSCLVNKRDKHVDYCLFRPLYCFIDFCTWRGTLKCLSTHFHKKHNTSIIYNGSLFKANCKINTVSSMLMSIFDNIFVISFMLTVDYMHFISKHVTYNTNLNFESEVKIINNDKVIWRCLMPCIKVYTNIKDNDKYEIMSKIPKQMYLKIFEKTEKINFTVNIYKLQNIEIKI